MLAVALLMAIPVIVMWRRWSKEEPMQLCKESLVQALQDRSAFQELGEEAQDAIREDLKTAAGKGKVVTPEDIDKFVEKWLISN